MWAILKSEWAPGPTWYFLSDERFIESAGIPQCSALSDGQGGLTDFRSFDEAAGGKNHRKRWRRRRRKNKKWIKNAPGIKNKSWTFGSTENTSIKCWEKKDSEESFSAAWFKLYFCAHQLRKSVHVVILCLCGHFVYFYHCCVCACVCVVSCVSQ